MKLRREASLGLAALLTLQLGLAGFAVTLLTRMSPAVEHILRENVYSAEAVEQMLAELATDDDAEQATERFEEALMRARSNVTEPGEPAILDAIEADAGPAFAGDASARQRIADNLRELGAVNRASMIRADERAQRLGRAGAWAAAVLGATSLVLGIAIYRRMRARIELPIEGVRRCLHQARGGNWQARCASGDSPLEIRQIADDVNWMLDELCQRARHAVPRDEPRARAALLALLEQGGEPRAVLDRERHIVAANSAALHHAHEDDGWEAWELTELGDEGLKLAVRRA